MKKGILLVLLLMSTAMATVRAQAFFSTDKAQFFDELAAYLNTGTSKQDREEAAVMMNNLAEVWNTYYTSQDAAIVIRLCELFHAKSGPKAYANIFNFAELVLHVPSCGLPRQDVINWLTYTDAKAQNSVNGFEKYLASCRNIFVEKTLSAKGNSKWLLREAKIGFPSKDEFLLTASGNLLVASSKDESVIQETRGTFYLDDNRWEGSGGRADWSRFGISSEKAFVILPDHYTLNLSHSDYAIDSVLFNDRQYFKEAILGRYEDKVLVNAPNEKTMYPRVRSYRSDYVIPNILKDVDFEGGIGMMGNQVDVFGGVENKAVFKFRQKGRVVVRAEAQRFMMSIEELLVSDHVSLRVYLNDTTEQGIISDSIYHNDLGFRYNNQKRTMMFYRSEKDYGDAPFHDYFHGVDIFLEAMYWNIDGNVVDFRRMEGVNPRSEGELMSVNYFRNEDFEKLRGLDGTHPMVRLEKFLKSNYGDNPNFFYVADFAASINFPIEQVISMLLRLQSEGYLEYYAENKTALVLPRFYDVIESSRENIDFDVFAFHTVTTGRQPNVRLDLNTNDLLVFGITSTIDGIESSAISLSDRKRVVIVPDNGRITLKRNHDFSFSGGILAGMFEFFTKDSEFNYENFTINMNKIDSLRFYARDGRQVVPVDGTLERLKGRLEIDRGDNKSSRYNTPEYPIFHSDAEGFKFYRKINGGVFHPGSVDSVQTADDLEGKFYYSLYPFVVDSLNDLSMKKVRFDGELVSAGILPNIVEPLVVTDDYSLGFDHQISKDETDTYPMYGDLGRLHNTVHLSSSGFYGNGQLDYQTAIFNSDVFLMYPDSVTAVTNQFKMVPRADGTMYPMANANALRMKWDVRKPALTTETIDNPICLYGDTYFSGKTTLTPEGYSADGQLKYGLTEFDSDHFAFDSRTFVADSADFLLYSADTASVAFSASNYRANMDFDAAKVKYDYLDMRSNLDFPMNQYICSLKEAEWDMTTNNLHVYNPVESFGEYANATTHEELLAIHSNACKFISLVPGQDSLQFYSMSAEYDMTNYVIHAHDVKIIRVADAAVFPYAHDVDIDSESKLEPVSGELLADTLNAYHLFKDAIVNIHSRNYYDAQGVWDYTDAGGVNTPIKMDTIVPVDGITHAYAHLSDADGFRLSTQFGFQGDLTLTATEPLGYYDGKFALMAFDESYDNILEPALGSELDAALDEVTELDEGSIADTVAEPVPELIPELAPNPVEGVEESASIASLNHWFVSSSYINPQDIRIPININTIREDDPNMCNGLYYELAIDGGYFGAFLTPREGRADTDDSAPSNGMLWFDSDSLHFVVTDTAQYDARLQLDSRGVITGHGATDLGFDTPLARFIVYGDYTQYPNDSLTLQGLNVFNAPAFDDKAMEAMAEVFANAVGMSIDLTQTNYLPYFRSENTEEQTVELQSSIELSGGYPEMQSRDFYSNTIVIPDLKMVWNDQLHAFLSVGKIGLGNFGNYVVNKYVDGYVMFDRRLGNITYFFQNDMFMTYINYNSGDGQFQVHCTFGDINQRLSEMKEKNRTRTKDGQRFQYVAVPYESMLDFLNRLKYAGFGNGGY